jgi:D-alanine transaminase
VILGVSAEAQLPVVERFFTVEEARNAREAFITAATLGATPIISLDGAAIGDGKPGPVARRVQELYRRHALSQAKAPAKAR